MGILCKDDLLLIFHVHLLRLSIDWQSWHNLHRDKNYKLCYNFCSDLKSIAELLGWEYKNNKFSNGKQMKVIKVRFEEFMEFMYPNIELEDWYLSLLLRLLLLLESYF